MYFNSFTILLTLCCWTQIAQTNENNVYKEIETNPELSKFKDLVDRDPVMQVFLQHRSATIFAPTNAAIKKLEAKHLKKEVLDKVASYHVVGLLVKKEIFPSSVNSSLQEAAPLYLSFKEHGPTPNKHRDYFVNNAKIISERYFKTVNGAEQLLYTIDEVLEPFIPSTPLPPFALEFIRQPSIYGFEEPWGQYYSKIAAAKQEAIFERPGNHTFFVPIGDLLGPSGQFDRYVVLGHVIPNNVLFLNVMGKESYRSAANDATVSVELSLQNRTLRVSPAQTYYVQSNTIKAEPKHNKGVVMSRILRSNIPVKNGVIHLIEKPLMIINTNIADFLHLQLHLKIFNRLLDVIPELRSEINTLDHKTILAPTDAAFHNLDESEDESKVQFLIDNPEQLKDILHLHMVTQQSVSTDDIRRGAPLEVMSADNRRSLYFRVVSDERNTRLTVEGGGVNATVVQADIGATNGIIHIIDKVLGMSFQNMYDKLRTDAQLTFSYELGQQGNQDWNKQLEREDRRFTYFVPSNEAWNEFRRENPSEYKQLEQKKFPQHSRNILDRHLVVNQQISSLQLESNVDTIHTVRGVLKVVPNARLGQLFIEWEGKRARIVRPDVQASNGVIHVIDKVLMKTLNSSSIPLNTSLLTVFIVMSNVMNHWRKEL